jgi:hypothetical protein
MAERTSTTRTKLELRPLEVGVGAGAAVITAFASSYVGTAGTLAGAALASIIGTVSTSVLRTSAARTNESLKRTTARLRRGHTGPASGAGSTAVDPGVAAVDEVERATGDASADAAKEERPALAGTRLDRGRRPAWAVLAAGAAGAFVVALIAITGIESAAGRPLAGLIGNEQGAGTTIGRTLGSDPAPASSEQDAPTPAPTPTGTGTEESTVPPDSPAPTEATTPSAEPTPSGEPTRPTAGPTGGPTSAPPVSEPAPRTVAPTP